MSGAGSLGNLRTSTAIIMRKREATVMAPHSAGRVFVGRSRRFSWQRLWRRLWRDGWEMWLGEDRLLAATFQAACLVPSPSRAASLWRYSTAGGCMQRARVRSVALRRRRLSEPWEEGGG